jgi:hypothetical protein
VEAAVKKIFFKLLPFVLASLLSACSSRFPVLQSVYVSPVDIGTSFTHLFSGTYYFALSPDGKTINRGEHCGEQIDLQTGSVYQYPYNNYTNLTVSKQIRFCVINDVGEWSPDGRYLAITENEYDAATNRVHDRIRIIDTKDHTILAVPGERFWMWSPFNTGTYVARDESEKGILGVYNMYHLDRFLPLDGSVQYDFTHETDVGGNGEYLWSKRLDLPIAELTPLRSGSAHNMVWSNVVILSFFDPSLRGARKYQKVLIDSPTSHVVGAIFDPTGEYVLVAEWICAYTDAEHCSDAGFGPPVLDGITDSVFTLIRWRTGEKSELFRLSSVDAENIAASGDLYWSADRSTIVLGRINASLVVLKVRYP